MIPGWGMDWNVHNYFSGFEGFVNDVFIWILVGFAAINVVLFAICAFKYRWFNDEFFHYWGLCLWYSILGLIAAFSVSSMIYSIGVYFSSQQWNFGTQYYGYVLKTVWIFIVVGVVDLIAAIIVGIVAENFWAFLITAAVGYPVLLFGLGFIIYIIIWFIWLLLRLVYVTIGVLGFAMYVFSVAHWLPLTLTIVAPAVISGLILALASYIGSLRDNIDITVVNNNRYVRQENSAPVNNEPVIDEVEETLTEEETSSNRNNRRRRHQ